MDKQLIAEFEKRDKVMDGIMERVERVESSTGSLEEFRKETEGTIAELKDSQNSPNDSDNFSNMASLHEKLVEEAARLQDRVAYLEGIGYKTSVIQEFLRNLDTDNYFEIGRKLGYLEEAEATPEDIQQFDESGIAEVKLGDNQVIRIAKTKPSDPDNWEFSETQGFWIQLQAVG